MKSEWKIVKFSDIVEITSSKRIFRSDYLQEGIPFYRSKEVIEKSKGNSISTELFISEKKFEEIRNRYGAPEEGDILLTSVGTLGTSYIVKNNERFYFKDGNLTWFRSFSQDANNKFIFYWLQSNHAKHIFDTITIGSTQKALTISALKSISFKLPPIQEQQKIASILNSLDDKIELNTAMNHTLEAMAQTIFKSWFVDFEPFKEDKFIESELGMIPEGWEVKKLKELTDTITKGTTPTTMRAKFATQGINFVKAESITNTHTFETSKFMYIDNDTHEKLKRSQLQNKDLLYTIAGTIGRYALVDNSILPANTNQAIAIIRPKQNMLHSEYLLCYFESIFYKTYLQSRVVQAVQANLSLGEISNSPILFPKKKSRELFHAKVEPLFKQIQQNQQQIQTLTALRDTLLPKLMSGEVRV